MIEISTLACNADEFAVFENQYSDKSVLVITTELGGNPHFPDNLRPHVRKYWKAKLDPGIEFFYKEFGSIYFLPEIILRMEAKKVSRGQFLNHRRARLYDQFYAYTKAIQEGQVWLKVPIGGGGG